MKNLFYVFSVSFLKYRLAKNLITCLTIILILLPQQSCNTTEPPNDQTLTLKLEDVSCTEAWIQLTTNNLQLPATINLLKNNTVAQTFSLSTKDSLLYIDSLLPNQTYKFKVVLTNNPQPTSYPQTPTSNELSVTTMDTTSHNFTWQTFTFGERTSTLYDVAIIDENNIWAVGEIYMNDSLGRPDPNAYNAVHWDGTKWELKRIYTYSACSSIDYAPLKSIYAFSENNIVVTSGGGMWWFNGNKWNAECSINPLLTGAINKLWGSNSNDLYAVGNNGNIAHWDGGKWTKIESGTTTRLTDIYGDGENVFICGYNDFMPTVLLRSKNGALTKVIEEDHFEYKTNFISGWVKSIWVKGNKLFSLTFYDLYRSSVETRGEGTAVWKGDISTLGSNAVRGNDVNDIFTTGYNGLLWHYNGVSWKRYDELVNPTDPFYSISAKGNIIVLAGERYLNGIERYGLIVIGKR